MFDKKTKNYTEQLGQTNRIVEHTRMVGDIHSPADFRFDGQLQGNIQALGKLVLGPSAVVIGHISCKNCDIEGKFEGKLEVEELLGIKQTAWVQGEVRCSKLLVEPGATFNAQCVMKTNVNAAHANPKTETV